MCLFFKQADDSNFVQKQGNGENDKTLSKLQNKKSKQTLAGLEGSKF